MRHRSFGRSLPVALGVGLAIGNTAPVSFADDVTEPEAEAPAQVAVPEPPLTSLYAPPSAWTNDRGDHVLLGNFSGQRVLLTMFYTTCRTHMCSVAIETLREVEAGLRKAGAALPIVLVSLDSDWDDAPLMRRYKEGLGLSDNWTFLVASEKQTRAFTDRLAYEFFEGDPSEIIHAYGIYVLDDVGRVQQVWGWDTSPEKALASLER